MATPTGAPNEVRVIEEMYKATVTIRGTRTTSKANERGYHDFGPVTKDISVMEIELTAPSLEKLQAKIKAHVDLAEVE